MPKPLPIRMLWGSIGLENRFRKGETKPMEFIRHQATWTHKFTKAMFEGAQAVWDDAYKLASTNATVDTDEISADSEKKAFSGSSKDKSQPQLSGTSNAADDDPPSPDTNAIDDFMTWHLGQYVWEFFNGFHPVDIFKVKDLLEEKVNEKNSQNEDDEEKEEQDDDQTPEIIDTTTTYDDGVEKEEQDDDQTPEVINTTTTDDDDVDFEEEESK
ncbi:hypothetical protein EV426DRAFT_51050 [Tirmania nivea]|nr:hypothetical protein EV426DRAFT_51050 [Tirmania nivea]